MSRRLFIYLFFKVSLNHFAENEQLSRHNAGPSAIFAACFSHELMIVTPSNFNELHVWTLSQWAEPYGGGSGRMHARRPLTRASVRAWTQNKIQRCEPPAGLFGEARYE